MSIDPFRLAELCCLYNSVQDRKPSDLIPIAVVVIANEALTRPPWVDKEGLSFLNDPIRYPKSINDLQGDHWDLRDEEERLVDVI
jgi:hypothetical protein